MNHPYFQRLRRIKQLGLTNLVYPGALHTRFHHALGAMHLMHEAITVLRQKQIDISEKEKQAALIAILLHDIGHGPFSHTLEHSIVKGVNHETLSSLMMNRLNEEFGGKLDLALQIFNDRYKKKFLHQLVSSQLDMDRLDYLMRDSFFTGVSEGVIGSERIIKMLNVLHGELVVEYKAIYSIEKFLIARRLMYWQVYLHKTVLGAEMLLVNILKRAKELSQAGNNLFATPALNLFLSHDIGKKDFENDKTLLDEFAKLDDHDIVTSIKVWCNHPDKVLSTLSDNLLNRRLYKVIIQNQKFSKTEISALVQKVEKKYKVNAHEARYFVVSDKVNNKAYNINKFNINMLGAGGKPIDVADASDLLNLKSLSKTVTKYFLCYPKEMD